MAGGIVDVEQGEAPPQGRPSSAGGSPPGLGWIPIALGTGAIVAGLGSRRNRGAFALALTAFAGVAAIAAVRDGQLVGGTAGGRRQGGASVREPEIERSITIGKTADELHRSLLDTKTLPHIMAGLATVQASGDGHTHWRVEGPHGRTYEWDAETVGVRPDEGIRWRSLPDAAIPNEGSIRFHPAPADRGTVATLHLRFDPPEGALGDAAVELLGTMPLNLAADGVLRRFKSLVETGEIPTTERQPAARADTR